MHLKYIYKLKLTFINNSNKNFKNSKSNKWKTSLTISKLSIIKLKLGILSLLQEVSNLNTMKDQLKEPSKQQKTLLSQLLDAAEHRKKEPDGRLNSDKKMITPWMPLMFKEGLATSSESSRKSKKVTKISILTISTTLAYLGAISSTALPVKSTLTAKSLTTLIKAS